jgi:uncharacterized protein YjbJ (UPF0337 family)
MARAAQTSRVAQAASGAANRVASAAKSGASSAASSASGGRTYIVHRVSKLGKAFTQTRTTKPRGSGAISKARGKAKTTLGKAKTTVRNRASWAGHKAVAAGHTVAAHRGNGGQPNGERGPAAPMISQPHSRNLTPAAATPSWRLSIASDTETRGLAPVSQWCAMECQVARPLVAG